MSRYPDKGAARFDQQFLETTSERNERLRMSRAAEAEMAKTTDLRSRDQMLADLDKARLPRANVLALEIDLPPEELRRHVATLIAAGLTKVQPSCVAGRVILASELETVAVFVLGGLFGLEAQSKKRN